MINNYTAAYKNVNSAVATSMVDHSGDGATKKYGLLFGWTTGHQTAGQWELITTNEVQHMQWLLLKGGEQWHTIHFRVELVWNHVSSCSPYTDFNFPGGLVQ